MRGGCTSPGHLPRGWRGESEVLSGLGGIPNRRIAGDAALLGAPNTVVRARHAVVLLWTCAQSGRVDGGALAIRIPVCGVWDGGGHASLGGVSHGRVIRDTALLGATHAVVLHIR